jgi:nitrate/TMAO reductase-like tetraheme cytochrome c subunit
MTWASAAHKKSPHYQNAVGVQASCGACHIPYDSLHATTAQYIYLLAFKANRGVNDFYHEAVRSIATKEDWERRRPELSNKFEGFLIRHNYITCQGCHQLQAFGGPHDAMKKIIHQGLVTSKGYDCLHCHSDIGHIYEASPPTTTPNASKSVASPAQLISSGWYAEKQTASGSKLYVQNCASCHGAKLEGGAGPALMGPSWKQMYAGTKLLTVWGEIHGPMAQDAGVTLSEQQSLDILAFLLQQNGLPAGAEALTDTRDLNRRLPKD